MIYDSHDLLTFIKIFMHFQSDFYSDKEKSIILSKFNKLYMLYF
jgi:hypothetical protein